MMDPSWQVDCGLEPAAAAEVAFGEDGISAPTEIQRHAVPPILAGQHAVIESGTGTGKTLAYLLPILQILRRQHKTRALIFSPSPELAMQTMRVAERYSDDSIAVGALVATASHRQQRAQVSKSTRLIVGTPGRILEMYRARRLKGISIIVLDEPDPILGARDSGYLREVLSRPEPKLQLVVVGATIGPAARSLISDFEPVVYARSEAMPLHEQIRHRLVNIKGKEAKDVQVARFIENNRCRRVILFVNSTAVISHLYRYLSEHRLKPVSLSADRPKQEHKEAIRLFAAGDARVLITTDKSTRGLDVQQVEWILHYDLPHSAQAYVHRAGRTGRAGRFGHSVVFCLPGERLLLKRYARELKLEFEVVSR